ncbi:MAG: hypothetical protein M4579_005512 [Chaenotheca gracillima]|nr:MAG: hypothetical protein M4579_005512 [Chaenotheca gracillima]
MGPSRPDIARFAGSNPLNSKSNSEVGNSDTEMEGRSDDEGDTAQQGSLNEDLMNTAQDALRAAEGFAGEASAPPAESSGPPPVVDPAINDVPSSGGPVSKSTATEPSSSSRVNPDITAAPESANAEDEKMGIDDQANVSGIGKDQSPNPSAKIQENGKTNGRSKEDSLATSPTLRDHTIPVSQRSPQQTLPALQQSKSSDRSHNSASSPPNENVNLPPYADLRKLAEAAADHPQDGRGNGTTSHRKSFSGASGLSAQSPTGGTPATVSQDRARGGIQQSPVPPHSQRMQTPVSNGQYAPSQTSPVSTYSETSAHGAFGSRRDLPDPSPPPGPGNPGSHPYYYQRRPSQASEHGPPFAQTQQTESPYPHPPSTDGPLNGEGYSPVIPGAPQDHHMEMDMSHSPSGLQMQHSGSIVGGGFKCDYPGCQAPPFHTQYLLNSHANVHSQDRPHYCRVKGCPRAEGGRGFKRKNEMIRHGLVHDSPGYICPFCPDRDHKYPRPDNLQRHVRAHHNDKKNDDPLLRDVLSQRPEGGNRGRRRRLGGH